MADIYSIYTEFFGIDPETVWHRPFYQVREIAANNVSINNWRQGG